MKKIKIRSRVLAAFSIVLFFSFLLIGVIFNVATMQYIHFSAITQLDNSFNVMSEAEAHAEAIRAELQDDSIFERAARSNTFRISSNMFVVDEEYNPLATQNHSAEMSEILQAVKDNNINLSNLRNKRIYTADGIYYISAHFVPNELNMNENAYGVVYVDITGFMHLASRVNGILVILVGAMFVLAVIVTFFLSNSITRPIEKLGMFALNIGRGDFTPNDFQFQDQELEDLNMALNKSAKQLGVYDSEQKAFFQNASHELRTPLMSIKCYAEGISFGIMELKRHVKRFCRRRINSLNW